MTLLELRPRLPEIEWQDIPGINTEHAFLCPYCSGQRLDENITVETGKIIRRYVCSACNREWIGTEVFDVPTRFSSSPQTQTAQSELNDLEDLDLSARTHHILLRSGLKSVDAICSHSAPEIKSLRNMGARSFDELSAKLAKIGRTFKEV